jgi:Ca2+-binding EF-hand superfamily protein
MMKNLLLGAAAVALAATAVAQTPTAPQPAPHAGQHRMMDQVQTRDGAVAMVRDHFARLDVNRDGALTTDEINAGRADRGSGRDGWKGRNGKRQAMRAAPMGDPAQAFDRLDTNRDGMISRDEFAKAREMRVERRVEMRGDAPSVDGQRGKRAMRMGGRGMGGHGMMLKMADADRDGRVTLAEAQSAAVRHFDMMDSNRDGRVTPEERRDARSKMRAMHAPKTS